MTSHCHDNFPAFFAEVEVTIVVSPLVLQCNGLKASPHDFFLIYFTSYAALLPSHLHSLLLFVVSTEGLAFVLSS